MEVREEDVKSDISGSIIDIETVGSFRKEFRGSDSRYYSDMKAVIFGVIDWAGISQYYIIEEDDNSLKEAIAGIIESLDTPLYAFNTFFERGVIYNGTEREFDFMEIQSREYEKKIRVCKELGIPNYDDVLEGDGLKCMNCWKHGDFDAALAHNRNCLLQERDILMKRGNPHKPWREFDTSGKVTPKTLKSKPETEKVRIPFEVAANIAQEFMDDVIDSCEYIMVAGSIRRKKKEVGDIDIVVIVKDEELFKKRAERWKEHPIEIYRAHPDNFGNIELIRTGNALFSKYMIGVRPKVLGMRHRGGYLLDKEGNKIVCYTEEDYFKAVKVKFIEPELRSWTEEKFQMEAKKAYKKIGWMNKNGQ